jgi:predicted RNase H-like HicB family nuclease
MLPRVTEDTGAGGSASAMRVVGRARGTSIGSDYDVYLLQEDGGPAYLASAGGGAELVIRSALTFEELDGQDLVRKARVTIALHNARDVIVTSEQDEDGAWCAQAVLAPGIAAFGDGTTREDAVEDCNNGLELLIDELRAAA